LPTKYQPVTDHQPFTAEELGLVDGFLASKREDIRQHFSEHVFELEDDDLENLLSEISQALVRFILTSKALPLRSPNQLTATLEKIADDPTSFLKEMGDYDPEAVARVMAVFARSSDSGHRFLLFDAGLGPPPSAHEVAEAAQRSIQEIRPARRAPGPQAGGRPSDNLQMLLAGELARIYTGIGGTITRRVHDREYGPFHQFLEIVLPVVRRHGRAAKSSLNVASMVRAAQDTKRL
jgi:hypothetical protein